jgi:hypothetical protein
MEPLKKTFSGLLFKARALLTPILAFAAQKLQALAQSAVVQGALETALRFFKNVAPWYRHIIMAVSLLVGAKYTYREFYNDTYIRQSAEYRKMKGRHDVKMKYASWIFINGALQGLSLLICPQEEALPGLMLSMAQFGLNYRR